MAASNNTIEQILNVMERYIDPEVLIRIAKDLMTVPGKQELS